MQCVCVFVEFHACSGLICLFISHALWTLGIWQEMGTYTPCSLQRPICCRQTHTCRHCRVNKECLLTCHASTKLHVFCNLFILFSFSCWLSSYFLTTTAEQLNKTRNNSQCDAFQLQLCNLIYTKISYFFNTQTWLKLGVLFQCDIHRILSLWIAALCLLCKFGLGHMECSQFTW